jgi:hypothetical protein
MFVSVEIKFAQQVFGVHVQQVQYLLIMEIHVQQEQEDVKLLVQ